MPGNTRKPPRARSFQDGAVSTSSPPAVGTVLGDKFKERCQFGRERKGISERTERSENSKSTEGMMGFTSEWTTTERRLPHPDQRVGDGTFPGG